MAGRKGIPVHSNGTARFPVALVAAAVVAMLCLMIWSRWAERNATFSYQADLSIQKRISCASARILHLDEILTMSARMAAATGDKAWIARYNQFTPELDRLIKECANLAGSMAARKQLAKTDESNQQLVRMEMASFKLVVAGRRQEAWALLTGPEYLRQKASYSSGVHAFLREIDSEEKSHTRGVASYGYLQFLARLALNGLVLTLWFLALRRMGFAWQQKAEKLRQSEDKFRGLFESSRDAVMTLEPPSWKFTSCNQATVEMFGAKDVEEFTSLGPWEVSPELQPDGRASGDKAKEMIETAMREGSCSFEWTHMRVRGEDFPATVLLSRVEQGERVFLQATVRCITDRKRAEEALQTERDNLAAAFRSSPVGMLLLDEETMIVDANSVIASMVSRSPGEIIDQRAGGGLGCVHSLENERGCGFSSVCGDCSLRQGLTQVLMHGTSIRGAEIQTTLLIGGQEHSLWLRVSAEPVTINGRKHVIVAIDDITEHKLLSEQLESAATQVKGLMTQVVTGNSFTGRFENPSLSRCWEEKKCAKTECPSYKNFGNLRCWEVAGTFCEGEVQGVFAQKYGDCSLCTVYRNARVNPVMELGETFNAMAAILENRREALVQAKAETEAANRQLVSALTQANELASQMEQARDQIEGNAAELGHQANHDALTGLPNRRYFEQHLHDLITGSAGTKSRSLAVLFLDLDRFKLINDTLGHKLGDLLLVEVAKRLQSCLRSGDVLARMGGDEFTAILSRCQSRSVAKSVASRMIDSIGRQFEIQGHKFVIGVSIGIARHPSDAGDAGTLIKYADAAMYKAKESGRNNCQFFSEEISQANEARTEIERDLRLAVERDELEVYYQPIVDVRTMRITGAEALLRWNHPDKGMISPGLFMPVAEETGLIVQVGKTVLETACKQCASWQEAGYTDLDISVNVSPIQLRDMAFASEVDNALSQAGLPPRCLRLEVIETALARTDSDELGVLRRLRVLGVSICIDDFGIGYSSLSRLNNLPIDHLKIDGHFIRNIESNKKDRAMAESIIVMAHNLGMQVTAEWVEDNAQLRTIKSLGCDYAQGYLISPALSSPAFEDFIREWAFAQRAADAA